MAKKKPAPILAHAVIGGKKFLIGKDWNETKNVMSMIDDAVEVVDKKMRTGVVDISVELFRGFEWTRNQMEKALTAIETTGAKIVTLEFLPKEAVAPKAKKAKKPSPDADPVDAAIPQMSLHAEG